MPLDLVLRQGRLAGGEAGLVDIGIAGGRIAEIAPPLAGWKRGRRSFTRAAAVLHRPGIGAASRPQF